MTDRTSLHHVVLITANLQRIAAFYQDVFALRLAGPPLTTRSRSVSLLSDDRSIRGPYLSFVSASRGEGALEESSQTASVTLGIERGSMDYWRTRLMTAGVNPTGRAWTFGQEHLCFTDCDAAELALVESDLGGCRLLGLELHLHQDAHRVKLMAEHLGLMVVGVDGLATRFQSEPSGVYLDLLNRAVSAEVQTGQEPNRQIVFKARSVAILDGITDYASHLGFPVSRDDGAAQSLEISLSRQCDFDFQVCLHPAGPELQDWKHQLQ